MPRCAVLCGGSTSSHVKTKFRRQRSAAFFAPASHSRRRNRERTASKAKPRSQPPPNTHPPAHQPTSPPAHQSTHPPPAFVHAPSGAHDPFPRPPSLPALPYPPASQPCSTRHDSVARKTRGEQSHALTLPTPATTLTKARQGKARQAQHSPLARPRAPTTGEKASCARCTALRARALANCLLGSHCACAVRSRERFAG